MTQNSPPFVFFSPFFLFQHAPLYAPFLNYLFNKLRPRHHQLEEQPLSNHSTSPRTTFKPNAASQKQHLGDSFSLHPLPDGTHHFNNNCNGRALYTDMKFKSKRRTTETHSGRQVQCTHRFTILTWNDVYEMSPANDGSGGLANLHTLMEQEIKQLERQGVPWISTLNGDFLSASLLASKFEGQQMIDVLNTMPLTHVCIGNHEFDFKDCDEPSDVILQNRIKESSFKWVNSNIFSREQLFPHTIPKEVITVLNEDNEPVRIGIFALCTGATRVLSFPPDWVDFENPITTATRMVSDLREKDNCSVVIVLTHLSINQDIQLATSVKGIDLILGGHDHQPFAQQQGSTTIMKCGQNGKFLGRIDLYINKKSIELNNQEFNTVQCISEWDFLGNFGYEPHPETQKMVDHYSKELPKDWNEFLAICGTPLDSTTSLVRSTETTMCSLLVDSLLDHYQCDAVILSAGIIRGDAQYNIGYALHKRDFYKEFPFKDYPKYGRVTGAQLIGAIEDGLKNIGGGGFCHLSRGFSVTYDAAGEIGSRVVSISLNGEEIDREKIYTVASTEWLWEGGDGWKHLMQGEIVPHEQDNENLRQHAMRWAQEKGVVKILLEKRLTKL